MGPLQRTPGTAPTAFSQNLPWLRRRERISLVKNRMREICTSGSVRGGGGNIPTYSALLLAERRQMTEEGASFVQLDLVAEEVKPTCGVKLVQPREKKAAEQLRKDPNREQESGARGDPPLAIERDAAARYDHVNVRMMRHRRAPGVKDGGDADAGAEMTPVGGDREHGLRRRPEQQIVDHRLVVEGDVGDLGRNGEDDMEIADRQQVGLTCGQPLARRGGLALGAVPVPAAVIGDAAVAALFASLDVSAERRGAAGLDGRHDLQLGEADMPGMGYPPGRPSRTEDVGDLQRRPHRRLRRPGFLLPSAASGARADWLPSGSSSSRHGRRAPSCRAWNVPGGLE